MENVLHQYEMNLSSNGMIVLVIIDSYVYQWDLCMCVYIDWSINWIFFMIMKNYEFNKYNGKEKITDIKFYWWK